MGKSRPNSPYYLTEAEIPPSGDPFWTRLAQKVLPHLEERRLCVDELMAIFPSFSYSVATNVLYWLDNNQLTRTEKIEKVVYWTARPRKQRVLPPTCCPVCNGMWKDSLVGIICVKCGRMRDYVEFE
jgi:hypothetical protein